MTASSSEEFEPIRPRDLATLLLASGDVLPRQRARDQQADIAGLDLKRRLLEAIVEHDPEPDEFEGMLLELVDQFGPPTGPTRSVAISLYEEWQTACRSPEWLALLLDQATRASSQEQRSGRRVSS